MKGNTDGEKEYVLTHLSCDLRKEQRRV